MLINIIHVSTANNDVLTALRQWHSLDRAEQAKYYEMARKEKELHRQLYPSWSARDNYAVHSKKKRRREHSAHDDDKGKARWPVVIEMLFTPPIST